VPCALPLPPPVRTSIPQKKRRWEMRVAGPGLQAPGLQAPGPVRGAGEGGLLGSAAGAGDAQCTGPAMMGDGSGHWPRPRHGTWAGMGRGMPHWPLAGVGWGGGAYRQSAWCYAPSPCYLCVAAALSASEAPTSDVGAPPAPRAASRVCVCVGGGSPKRLCI
jgi:hypothetical protein